ncbi:MAG TPA: nuclear transport factor 2 family protein [Thermoanaerobaculia bacterium]|jgi:hypothetical protein
MTEPAPNDEARVRALMSEISRAFQEGDVKTLDGIFDESFTLNEPSGDVITKEKWLADVASGDLRIESVESDAFDIRRVDESSFRVRGQLRIRAQYSKANYNGTFAYMGVYRKDDTGWKLVLSSARRA